MLNNNRAPFLPAYPAPISHSDREAALAIRMTGAALPAPKNADARLTKIIMKACAYDPKDRYDDPTQMRQALEAILYDRASFASDTPSAAKTPEPEGTETVRVRTPKTEQPPQNAYAYAFASEVDPDAKTETVRARSAPVNRAAPREDVPPSYAARAAYGKATKKEEAPKRGWTVFLVILVVVLAAGCLYMLAKWMDGVEETVEVTAAVEETDIAAVSAGYYHTVGLKADGTVVAVGDNSFGQCDVSDWQNIVAVSAGCYHTVGLKSDGTVVAVGENDCGQCNVSDW